MSSRRTTTGPVPRTPTGSAPFRLAMRTLAGGVVIVSAHDRDGSPMGLTATSCTSLSAEPPSLIVCVNRRTDIATSLVKGATFGVNVLSAQQSQVARAFGGQLDVRGAGRFANGTWHRSSVGEVPMLVEARAFLECIVADVHDWQSHHIVIGTVLDVQVAATPDAALAYCDGAYGSFTPLESP